MDAHSRFSRLVAAFGVALTAAAVRAQSFNVEFGSAETAPPASYAAAGFAGHWNSLAAMPDAVRFPLAGLDGQPIAADIMNIGFDAIESTDIPGTSGGDEALLDDCFVSYNDPIDGCLFIRFLQPGGYLVILYGLAPDDDELASRLRIDQNMDDPELVGGRWEGAHVDGISYMAQIATVGFDGRLDVHSGFPGSNTRSVLNGMQVIKLRPCRPDFTRDGVLNFFDLAAFLSAFSAGYPIADFINDGVFDFFDVAEFLAQFAQGCP